MQIEQMFLLSRSDIDVISEDLIGDKLLLLMSFAHRVHVQSVSECEYIAFDADEKKKKKKFATIFFVFSFSISVSLNGATTATALALNCFRPRSATPNSIFTFEHNLFAHFYISTVVRLGIRLCFFVFILLRFVLLCTWSRWRACVCVCLSFMLEKFK